MKSSYLTNLVLLAIVIALLWLTQKDTDNSSSLPILSTLQPEQVETVIIRHPERADITLDRNQQGWQLTAPFVARANTTRINLLLSLLSSTVHGQLQPQNQETLSQFGLDQPLVEMQMNDQIFAFGNLESLSQQRYLLHDQQIFLVEDNVVPLLQAGAASFVDNRLLSETDDIRQLVLPVFTGEQGDFNDYLTISQSEQGWHSNNDAFASDTLSALVDNWRHAYAMQVRHLTEEQITALPAAQIQLWLENHSDPMRLILTLTKQNVVLTEPVSQLQYLFPKATLKQLLPTPEAS